MTCRYAVIPGSIAVALMIAAPKLTVAALVLVAVVFGMTAWRCSPEEVLSEIRRNRFFTIGLIGIVLVAIASSGWHFSSDPDYEALAKVLLIFVIGVLAVFAVAGIPKATGRAVNALTLIGFALGLLVIAIAATVAATSGQPLWGSFYFDPLTTLNNSAAMLALFFWPAIAVAWRLSPRMATVLTVLTVILLSCLSSAASVTALLSGFTLLVGRRFLGRKFAITGAAIAALLMVASPSALNWADKNWEEVPKLSAENPPIVKNSFQHRLVMWAFVAKRIEEKPYLGWGFNASRHIPQEEYRLAPNMEIMPLHPHNLSLQTRLELGVPGVLILASLVFAVFYRLATFTDDGWKSGVAMAAATGWLFVANVSYGMWQSWWIALAFLLAILMKIALAECPRTPN
ncbi:MAG: O-antigen ligase family protein [Rhodospirillales bacterium]|nr:O-antigen ligase family protein [Rhodospirillales bacterium]